jgi:hypothetical protein
MFGQRPLTQPSYGSRIISQQMEYPQYNRFSHNDHLEMYSTSNDSRSISESQFSQHKRTLTEDICNFLCSTLENSIPRIAEQCLNIVISKLDSDFEMNKKQLSNLKEDLFQLKDSINSFSDVERDLNNTYHTNIIKKIDDIKSEVEKNLSLKNEIKDESAKDLIKFNKSKEAIVKILADINTNAKDRSDVIMNVSRLLNDQIIVDEISSYLDNKINSLTSTVNFNKNQVKMPLKMEDISMKMDIINENFLKRFNNEKQSTTLTITPSVSLSITNQGNKKLVSERELKFVPNSKSNDSMMLDEFTMIVNNFDKMKNVQPKKKKKNQAKNTNFYSQFYY